MNRITWIALLVLFASTVRAAENPAVVESYGDLFFVEHLEKDSPLFVAHVGPGLVFSNPYFETLFLNASLQTHLNRYFRIGVDGYIYRTRQLPIARTIETQLQGVGIRQWVDERVTGIFGTVSAIPFSGHLAFFGVRAIPLSLTMVVGVGSVVYRTNGAQPEFEWKVELGSTLNQTFRASIHIGQWIGFSNIGTTDTFGVATVGVGL